MPYGEFLFIETFIIFVKFNNKPMEVKRKFEVIYLPEAREFLISIESKARDKILYNIDKASYVIDPKLFKKLEDSDI